MGCDLSLAIPGEAPGSLGFMAPEAMVKNVPDPTKLDVWSAACVLLELVNCLFYARVEPFSLTELQEAYDLISSVMHAWQGVGHEWFDDEWLAIYKLHRGADLLFALDFITNLYSSACLGPSRLTSSTSPSFPRFLQI